MPKKVCRFIGYSLYVIVFFGAVSPLMSVEISQPETVFFTGQKESLGFGNRLLLYEAPRHSVDPKTIPELYQSGAFAPVPPRKMFELNGENEHWLAFRIQNDSPDERLVLYLQWYRFTKVRVWMGCAGNKALPQMHNPAPAYILSIPKGKSCTVFLEAGHALYYIDPPLLVSRDVHAEEILQENIFFGLFFGVLLTLAIYHMAIFFSLKDKTYILYTIVLILMVLQNASFNGYTFYYSLVTDTDFFRMFFHGTWMLSILTLPVFIRTVIESWRLFPRADVLVKYMLITGYASAPVILYLDRNESLLIKILPFMYVILSVSSLSVFALLLAGSLKRQRIYIIMLVAFSSYLLSIMVFSVSEVLLLPHTFFTRHAELIGTSVQAVLFSFILSDRINNLRREKIAAQAESLQNKDLALNSLEQAARIKDEFLAKTSHELRTPLQGMIALAEYLMESSAVITPEEIGRNLNLVRLSGKRLSVLVNDLLDYSKMKEGGIILQHKDIFLRNTADGVCALHRVLLNTASVRLELDITEDICVSADEDRLAQILHNLVGNAIRFTEQGVIRVSATEADGMVMVSVDDTGTGIPPEMRETVFEEFRQLDNGKRGGTGLGLAITKKLVELHGGRIRIETGSSGSGTCVQFSLPSVPCSPACSLPKQNGESLAELHVFRKEAEENAIAHNAENTHSHPQILLVDDDPIIIASLSRLLSLEGYRVFTASSAAEARELLAKNTIDIAVVDVMMPVESGYDLCRDIRNSYSAASLPVLLLSAHNQTTDFLEGINAGANDYLAKPVTREELSMRLGGLLATRKNYIAAEQEKEIMKEILQNERQRIYGDLHDNIAGYMTDLLLLARQSQGNAHIKDLASSVENLAQKSIGMLRDRLQSIEDLSLLEQNPVEALEVILHGRYSSVGRSMQWKTDLNNIAIPVATDFRQDLYSIFMELANNDIKYGNGQSAWELKQTDSHLGISMNAYTSYDFSRNRLGRGTSLLQERVSRLQGEMKMEIKEGEFNCNFIIPI